MQKEKGSAMSDMSVLATSPVRRLADTLLSGLMRFATRLRVQVELSTMDDRTLADLGLSRADIARVARAHAAAL
jgi:uncharacterized protein YjiS (DUF1127 family)